MYNRLLARSQALGALERAVEQWKGTVAQSPGALPPRPLPSHAPRLTPYDRRGPPPLPRAELGIHGLNRCAENCLEKSEKRGVQSCDLPFFRFGTQWFSRSGCWNRRAPAQPCGPGKLAQFSLLQRLAVWWIAPPWPILSVAAALLALCRLVETKRTYGR